MIINNYDDFLKYIEGSPERFYTLNGVQLKPEDLIDKNIWATVNDPNSIDVYEIYGTETELIDVYYKKYYLIKVKNRDMKRYLKLAENLKKELKLLEGE